VVVVINPVATRANIVEFMAALLSLAAVFAVLSDGFIQILFGFLDVVAALVIPVGARGNWKRSQQRYAEHGGQQQFAKYILERHS